MKATAYLLVCLTAFALRAFAQTLPARPLTPGPTPPPGPAFSDRLQNIVRAADATPAPALTKFSLDFPGGTPKQLVAAIEKAMGRPLNVIIPNEFADQPLPPLKMNNVDIGQLSSALEQASRYTQVAYGFGTDGVRSDDSVWSFFSVRRNSPPSEICRFYALSPYLEHGLTVDDITTAIQTGWKMLGDKDAATISFHKETKLLIAVGEPEKLQTIDAVLKALDTPKPKPAIDPATGLPVQKTESKAGQK